MIRGLTGYTSRFLIERQLLKKDIIRLYSKFMKRNQFRWTLSGFKIHLGHLESCILGDGGVELVLGEGQGDNLMVNSVQTSKKIIRIKREGDMQRMEICMIQYFD